MSASPTIPVTSSRARANWCAATPRRTPPAEETVLVIDDSVTFREALKAALEQAVLSRDRVRQRRGRACGWPPISGRPRSSSTASCPASTAPRSIRRIRLDAALRGLPCLLLTASEDRGAEVHALDAGADAFVRKDEDIAVILARLKAVLRSAGAQRTPQDRGTASLLGPKKILAVDDSETYLQELAEALRADGYEVVLARSGEEALQLLAVQPVDCVLLDLLMPGIGGRETCRRVEERARHARYSGRDADRGRRSRGDDPGARRRRRRLYRQVERFRSCCAPACWRRSGASSSRTRRRRIREQLLRAELEAVEARAAREMAEERATLVAELEAKNEELEVLQLFGGA